MRNKLTNILMTFILLIVTQLSFSQDSFFKKIRLEGNLNIANKKSSYGILTDNKYAVTKYYLGYDLGLHYETELFEFGVEYYSPYQHINLSFGYRGLSLVRGNPKYKIIPDFKLGYTPVLNKVFTGFGASLQLNWFTLSYNRLLHVKSGSSRYYGDGLNVISLGLTSRIFNLK